MLGVDLRFNILPEFRSCHLENQAKGRTVRVNRGMTVMVRLMFFPRMLQLL